MNDEALEELSLSREPRQRGASTSGKSLEADLPKFSAWAAGRESSLETATLTKHVRQMVDVRWLCVCVCVCVVSLWLLQAVFAVYDTDHSGNISMEEFEAISSNFPFIECFSVLDQDK